MKKLIGTIGDKKVVIDCEDNNAVARTKRAYAKHGVVLSSYDRYIQREAKRLLKPRTEER